MPPPNRLALAELLRLDQAARYGLTAEAEAAPSGFGPQSPPYLWASEFPGELLPRLKLAPPVLCVAGSGDVVIELLRLSLWPLVAVDVSRPACYVNELKAAALAAGLSRQDYLGLLPSPTPEALGRLNAGLSPQAAAFWRRTSLAGGVEGASLIDAEPYLAGLPYLATEAAFEHTRRGVRPWPVLNLSLEGFLRLSPEGFGTVYVSNVGEYVSRSLLLAERDDEVAAGLGGFYRALAAALLPGGSVVAYVFAGCEQAGPEAAAMAAAGLAVERHPLNFRRFGTLFAHCLLRGRRP